MAIIETFGLGRSFGNLVAVTDLTLEVDAGEILGFLGPNGAGKTTTIRLLAGMIAPTKGYAVLDGLRPDKDAERVHEAIGLLTESPGFYHRLTARRNLKFFAGFYPGLDAEEQSEKYLKLMGLWSRRDDKVGTFSKGMKQRLALARALLHEPKVLFLDEPTAGLDPEAATEVRHLIGKLGEEGRTILLSTHNLNEAESLCHRIAVINTRLLAMDTAERLRQRFFQRQVIVQLESEDRMVVEAVKRLAFVVDIRQEGNQLFVVLSQPEQNRPELIKAIVEAGGKVFGVSEKHYSLEDVYLRLIQEERGNDP
ncbi:MAG: Multidrug transporter ATP-binding protein [Dehalococcoidales bacterium]|nr:Multidrug transporter ATP-binding protein [Dehalococcoidales bacterium]